MRTRLHSRALLMLVLCLCGVSSYATVFGTVRGLVHDPQHRPLAGATVVLKATSSGFQQTATTDADGTFEFRSVPVGEYGISVSHPGFASEQQTVFLNSSSAPVLHYQLAIPKVEEQ